MPSKKQKIKQKIIATLVIAFMVFMIVGSVDIKDTSAIGTNTTLIQNLVAGSLSMEAPATLAFNDINLGTATNSLANMSRVNMRDYRGSGAYWSVTATMNSLYVASAGVNNISNAVVAWAPGTLYSDNGTNTGVVIGSAGYFSGLRTLMNAGNNTAMGNYNVTGTVLNVVYNGSVAFLAGSYQNAMTMTIQ
jgi:hypothetical protein